MQLLNFIVFFVLILPLQTFAQSQCAKLFIKTEQKASTVKLQASDFQGDPYLILSQYNGSDNFGTVSAVQYKFNGNRFEYHKGVRSTHIDDNILAAQQDFSLSKMVETGYLKGPEAEYFKKLGTNLNPQQVSFFELIREITRDDYERLYGFKSHHRNAPIFISDNHENYRVKTAAMWNISGQYMDPVKGLVNLSLPWEKEESRKDQALDRSKYKFVFEWGRAAQDVPKDIANIYAANTMLTYMQVKALNGNIDDAYVMVHSFDKVNTRLYSSMHPDSLYGENNPDDALFLVPLKEAIEKYKPSLVSENIHKIIELSGGKLTELQALDLFFAKRSLEWEERDYVGRGADNVNNLGPVILADYSTVIMTTLWNLIRATANLEQTQVEKLFDYLLYQPRNFHTLNYKDKYLNAADSQMSAQWYMQRMAIEISNLDPKIAAQNPDYVFSALMSTFFYAASKLTYALERVGACRPTDCTEMAFQYMHQKNLSIGITTHDPEIASQIARFKPVATEKIPKTIGNPGPEEIQQRPFYYRDAHAYFFSFEQLWAMHAQLTRAKAEQFVLSFKTDRWFSQYYLSLADML